MCVDTHLPVLRAELAHQHAHVLRVPLPVLAAEVLQQADGLVQTVEDAHHPKTKRVRGHSPHTPPFIQISSTADKLPVLLRLLSRETQEEVVDEGGELVADQDPVLVDQVVGGDVGVGPAESLLQRVPLEGRHHVVLCEKAHGRGG